MSTTVDSSRLPWPHWIERVLLAAVAAIVLAHLAVDLWDGLFTMWSGSRLAFAAAVARGLDVYPTADAGVVTGDMYGPVMALFYVPALLAPGVTAKILVAEIMTVAVMLAPAALLVTRVLRRRGLDGFGICAALIAIVGVLLVVSSTRYQLTSIHADGPCLGLGMFSYLVLSRAARPRPLRLLAAALLVALATLSKPQGAFVAAGEALLLLRSAGLRPAALFSAAYAAAVAGLGPALVFATGSTLEGMWFNCFVIPARQALDRGILDTTSELCVPLVVFALLTVAAVWFARRPPSVGSETRPIGSVVAGLWTITLVLVPVSIAARLKIGGDVNSFHAHYYAAVATVLAGADALATRTSSARVLVLACLAASLTPLETVGNLFRLPPVLDNPHELATAYLRRHGDAYLPWHSLASLEARGELFHHADGIHSRVLAGLPLSRDHFFAHAPRAPAYVVMPSVGRLLSPFWVHLELVNRYYPGYVRHAAEVGELRALDMQVFRRP